MRAATIRDGDIAVEEHTDPEPGAGEILVRVHAAGLNGADMLQKKGVYPAPPGSPQDIPGLELAGEVLGVGPAATRFSEGDSVMAIVGGGGQGELMTIHERQAMPVPEGVELPAAGGIPEVFTTAHDAIFTQGLLKPGERLLVHGAAGGVGTAAVQLGRMAGAHVTATVRNPDNRDKVADLGAHEVLDPEGFEESGTYDVILELVGAPNFPGNLKALSPLGRIVVIGVGAGAKVEVNLHFLMSSRGLLRGSTLRARALEDKAAATRRMEREVLPGFTDGRLRVPIAKTFPLDEVSAAYDYFAASGKLGKVILEL